MTVDGATAVVAGAGYEGKRGAYERLAELGVRAVIVDEPGHWSESLVGEGVAAAWVPAPVSGDPDVDAAAVLDGLAQAGVRPDGVLTFWEDSVCTAARVAAGLGLPGNPPEAVDAARSKVRTRQVSERLGIPSPKARRVRSLDELYAAAAEIGFPAVVKPEFGAAAMGCVRVDSLESLPGVYKLVRGVVRPETDGIFRAGNDLLLEEYLDGVEFDVDLVMEKGECVFSSASQNWPTAEPSFQEKGLHCPPDHTGRAVRRLVDFSVRTVQAFGFARGVLHVEGKSTSRGPRIVEINARMGGARVNQIVEAVWGVDLVEAQLRSAGTPASAQAEPQAALRRRERDRARARQRPARGAAVRGGAARGRARNRARRRRRGRAGGGRARRHLRDRSRGADPQRKGPAPRAGAGRGRAARAASDGSARRARRIAVVMRRAPAVYATGDA